MTLQENSNMRLYKDLTAYVATSRILCIQATPDSATIVVGGQSGYLKQFTIATLECKNDFSRYNTSDIVKIAISEGSLLAANRDGVLKMLSLTDGDCLYDFGKPFHDKIFCMSVSNCNNYVWLGDNKNTVRMLNLKKKKFCMSRDNIHRSPIMAICFTWDGKDAVICELNGSLKQWGTKIKSVKQEFKKLPNFNITAMAI